jgi:hypothetical protein
MNHRCKTWHNIAPDRDMISLPIHRVPGLPIRVRGKTRIDVMRRSGSIDLDMPARAWNWDIDISDPIVAMRVCETSELRVA